MLNVQTHLSEPSDDDSSATPPDSPYLTASHGQAASAGQPLRLDIVQSLTADQLAQAYGRTPPIPVDPPAIASSPLPRDESVLAEIQRTGVLTVAFRKDAPPFGYIDQTNAWDGYCGDMAIALSNYLTDVLDSPVDVELVELASTLQNRFDLVRQGNVHLECGPNTIRTDVEGVTFSQSMLAAGTRFLTTRANGDAVNPNQPLDDARLGVLEDTTAEVLVQSTYPEATIVPFAGPRGRQEAVRAVSSGRIDAFVSDDILSYAELLREDEDISRYALVPEVPLSCEFYGLILPEGDSEWKATVDRFLASDAEDAIFTDWFSSVFPFSLQVIDYCLNRR